jgi:transcriptional regulator with XRE-family HTH domain
MAHLRNRARQLRLDYQQRLGRTVTIAEVADAIGLTRAALSRIEANKAQPSADTIAALCAYYKVQPGDLLEVVEDGLARYAVQGQLAAA